MASPCHICVNGNTESLRVQEEETHQQVLALPQEAMGSGHASHACPLYRASGECHFGLWTLSFSKPFTPGPAGFELQDFLREPEAQ